VLTPRQEQLLERVIQTYLDTGSPVGSKALAGDLPVGPSTVRHELSVLEEHGLLDHPHTSAGRVPTDAGYRFFVDKLLPQRRTEPAGFELSLVRREIDEAMRVTSEALSELTSLLAVVTAPPLETATIRHVEVLLLQPRVLMVVVITSTGGVTKRVFALPAPVDTGLASWAAAFLNERLTGLGLGARMLQSRILDPDLGAAEEAFLRTILPAFTELEDAEGSSIYLEGTSRLLADRSAGDVTELNEVMSFLERRVTLLGVLRDALGRRDTYVSIGSENQPPALRSYAVVAQSYGLATRSLGAVSVIGPVRMDYELAIGAVRSAAHELSRFIDEVYDS
jgi:heat-inducible transcriptional repressor